MVDNVENLILEHLRAIRADIGGIKDDLREIKHRLTSLEAAVAGLRRDNSNLYGDVIDQHARYDRLVERVERIERRLDLADGQGSLVGYASRTFFRTRTLAGTRCVPCG